MQFDLAFYPPFRTCYSVSSFRKIPVADFSDSAFYPRPQKFAVNSSPNIHKYKTGMYIIYIHIIIEQISMASGTVVL